MATARPRPQVMRAHRSRRRPHQGIDGEVDQPIAGLRVGVRNGGCAGMAYTMEYAQDVGPTDEVVEDKGVRILIDPKAVLFLLGTEMDYKTDKMAAQFVFNNPNQTSACGCGEIRAAHARRGRKPRRRIRSLARPHSRAGGIQ